MKKVEIAYTSQMFEEIVNRNNIEIIQVDVKGIEPNALFQQGFIGIVYYEEINNEEKNDWINKEVIDYDWENEGFGDESIKRLLNKGYEKGYSDALNLMNEMIKALRDIAEGLSPSSADEAFIFAGIAKKIADDALKKYNNKF